MNRGDQRGMIFMDDADRQRFVETLGEVCAKTGWQVHAYVLMPNHFHWVVETPQPNLVAGMKWLLGEWGIPEDGPEGRQRLEQALEELIIAEDLKRGRWQEADLKTRPKGGSEGDFGGALAVRDDDDGGVDRRASGDGHARLSEPSLVSPEEAGREVANTRTDSFTEALHA